MVVILSIDQATTSGYALTVDGELTDYGSVKVKGETYHDKIHQIANFVFEQVDFFKPNIVSFEGVQMQGQNPLTYSKLSGILFVLVDRCIERGVKYVVLPPSQWRSRLGLKTKPRDVAKEDAKAYINARFGTSITSDDISDAIAMNCCVMDMVDKGDIDV